MTSLTTHGHANVKYRVFFFVHEMQKKKRSNKKCRVFVNHIFDNPCEQTKNQSPKMISHLNLKYYSFSPMTHTHEREPVIIWQSKCMECTNFAYIKRFRCSCISIACAWQKGVCNVTKKKKQSHIYFTFVFYYYYSNTSKKCHFMNIK